jgi:hypothetical protein
VVTAARACVRMYVRMFWGRYDDGVEQRTRWGVAKW